MDFDLWFFFGINQSLKGPRQSVIEDGVSVFFYVAEFWYGRRQEINKYNVVYENMWKKKKKWQKNNRNKSRQNDERALKPSKCFSAYTVNRLKIIL